MKQRVNEYSGGETLAYNNGAPFTAKKQEEEVFPNDITIIIILPATKDVIFLEASGINHFPPFSITS